MTTRMPPQSSQVRDMRGSDAIEAFCDGADLGEASQMFGNLIDRSSFLFKTYNPVDIEQVRQADEARVRGGRSKLGCN